MDKDNIYNGLYNYFTTITKVGYKNYQDVENFIIYMFLCELLEEDCVDEKQANLIQDAINCLYNTSCLIALPDTCD